MVNLIPAILGTLSCMYYGIDRVWWVLFVLTILNWLAFFQLLKDILDTKIK